MSTEICDSHSRASIWHLILLKNHSSLEMSAMQHEYLLRPHEGGQIMFVQFHLRRVRTR